MGCFKQLSMAKATSDEFTPLFSAVYVASSGKILGTMENYVLEFNATTGALIRAVKAISPMNGPMWIGLINGEPWISCFLDNTQMAFTAAENPRRNIFKLDTSTLEATGSGALPMSSLVFTPKTYYGPRQFFGIGTMLYTGLVIGNFMETVRVDTANTIDWDVGPNNFGYWVEMFCTNGTDLFFPDPFLNEIIWINGGTMAQTDYSDTSPYTPVATEWVSGSVNKPYAVCSDKNMVRVDVFASSTNTIFDLEALSGLSGIKPLRLRYNSANKNLYIPCQAQDSIIVFDTVAETATVKAGFASPIDVVFTPTKIFAVQSSLVGLKELV